MIRYLIKNQISERFSNYIKKSSTTSIQGWNSDIMDQEFTEFRNIQTSHFKVVKKTTTLFFRIFKFSNNHKSLEKNNFDSFFPGIIGLEVAIITTKILTKE